MMSRPSIKLAARDIGLDPCWIEGSASSFPRIALGDAAEIMRLKAALKKAVAKTDAPAYLIDAIRREVRK